MSRSKTKVGGYRSKCWNNRRHGDRKMTVEILQGRVSPVVIKTNTFIPNQWRTGELVGVKEPRPFLLIVSLLAQRLQKQIKI